jgi:heme O synthase-like polyprenyltransferase
LSGLTARVPDFIALMKPRVMVLAVQTGAVGLANLNMQHSTATE